jgi:hypothetical protein
MSHPRAGSPARDTRHVEQRDDAAGIAALVAMCDVPHVRVVSR